MANKQLANANYTYITMVFPSKPDRTFSTKTFLNGEKMHEHSLYNNFYSYMDSTIFMDMSLLITNIKSFKKPTYVGSFFLNLLLVKKFNIVNRNTCAFFLLTCQWYGAFVGVMVGSFTNFFIRAKWLTSTCFSWYLNH
jgi:hypothetical protein